MKLDEDFFWFWQLQNRKIHFFGTKINKSKTKITIHFVCFAIWIVFFELNFAANWIRRFFSNNEQRFDSLEPFVREEVYLSDFWTFWPKKVISISLLRAAMPCQCVCERICQKEKQFSQFHQHCMSNFFTNFILTLKIQRQTVSGEKLGWTLFTKICS